MSLDMTKNTLHKNKLEDFKRWCTEKGVRLEEPAGDYQVLRIRDQKGLHVFYAKDELTQHILVPFTAMHYVINFLKAKKKNKVSKDV